MRLAVNCNSTDRTVAMRTSGNDLHTVGPEQLPSFKSPRCIIDLIYRHAELDSIASEVER